MFCLIFVTWLQEEEKRTVREKERECWERKYTLPETPHIVVHPSPTAKSGRFDCSVMSLSVLLDYRPEDNKEHSFEVRYTSLQLGWFAVSVAQKHMFLHTLKVSL
jgi:LAIKA domain